MLLFLKIAFLSSVTTDVYFDSKGLEGSPWRILSRMTDMGVEIRSKKCTPLTCYIASSRKIATTVKIYAGVFRL